MNQLKKNTTLSRDEQVLHILEKIGRTFIPDFKFTSTDIEMYTILINYFLGDKEFEKMYSGFNLKKGLLLRGDIGVGKSLMIKIFRSFMREYQINNGFKMLLVTDVVNEYQESGHKVIINNGPRSYKKGGLNNNEEIPLTICYDDLGTENTNAKYYGSTSNVMTDILLKRYDLFISFGMKTHIITNFDGYEIELNYGRRIRSRMREMMNDIVYSGFDRRI